MSIDVAWECLSVADFIDNCHWFGWSPEVVSEVAELSISVQELKQSLLAWQTLTAQDFFSSNNWNGLSTLPSTVRKDIPLNESQIFSFTLANDQFWSCFSWIGSTSLPVNTETLSEPIPDAALEYTLQDLSQLF